MSPGIVFWGLAIALLGLLLVVFGPSTTNRLIGDSSGCSAYSSPR